MPAFAAQLLAERVGFGAKTTGGDPVNHLYRVTTLADSGPGSFRAGIESPDPNWIRFDVKGTIVLAKDIQIKHGNKTIDGRGQKITIKGGLKMTSISNVIMSDFAIQNPNGDAIGIRGTGTTDPAKYDAKNFWFHHLELFDSQDGLIDVRGGTDITISWCHEHTHLKAHLLAKNTHDQPTPGMRLTVHHNYFQRITRRGVNMCHGLCDYFNNFQYRWYEWGNGSYDGAQMLSEANIYEARPGFVTFERDPNPGGDYDWLVSKKGLVTALATYSQGFTRSVNDVALEGADITVNQPTRVFDRAKYYQATVDKPDKALLNRLINETGPR
jgi:pectate lyase